MDYSSSLVENFFKRLSKYISVHHYSLQQFWKSKSTQIKYPQFKNFCNSIGFDIPTQEQIVLKQQLSKFQLKNVKEKISFWNGSKYNLLNFLGQQSNQIATEKYVKYNNKLRPTSSQPVFNRPQKERIKTPEHLKSKQEYDKKSIDNLKKYKQKEKKMEENLMLTIKMGKIQKEKNILIKLGQVNQINEQLNQKITFRAFKSANGDLVVRKFEEDNFVEQKSIVEFQRQYNLIKKKYNESRNLKWWDVLSVNKNSVKSFKNIQISKQNKQYSPKKVIKKKQRQQELKNVLQQTMKLTNVLKQQLRILKKKGIYITK